MLNIIKDCMIKERQIKALLHAIYQSTNSVQRSAFEEQLKVLKSEKAQLEVKSKLLHSRKLRGNW